MQYKSDKSDKCDQSESVRMNRVAVETYIYYPSVFIPPTSTPISKKRFQFQRPAPCL